MIFQLSKYNDPTTGNGVSAWSQTQRTGECYLHQGLSTQPDLNLRSAQVQEELEVIFQVL